MSWLLLQVVDILVPMLALPEWVGRLVLLLIVIAFPISLLLAWAFELTPNGVKREKDVDRTQSVVQDTGRKLDRLIIGVLVIAVIALAFGQFGQDGDGSGPDDEVVATEVQRSIAVMPFVDLSQDQNDDFFGKGVAEELLNSLAKYPDLRVAARTSAFALGEKDLDLRDVGEQLGVSHVLEGSVRRAGEQLRITAQLIRAADGMHLWSETYDRPEADVLAIQDAIVGDITRALEIRLGIGAGAGRARNLNVDPRAYETYLQGLFLWSTRNVGGNRTAALKQLRLATELDPEFADAHAAYGITVLYTTADPLISGIPRTERSGVVRRALATALELDPDNARAHAAYGTFYLRVEIDLDKSKAHLEKANSLAPNSALTHYATAIASVPIGDYAEAQRSMDRALLLDPLNVTMQRVQSQIFLVAGHWDSAQSFLDGCRATTCGIPGFNYYDLMARIHMGQKDEALRAIDTLHNGNTALSAVNAKWLSLARAAFESDAGDFWSGVLAAIDQRDSGFEMDDFPEAAFHSPEHFDVAMNSLYTRYEEESFWLLQFAPLLLSAGEFQLPDDFRKYSGYHDFWDRDGWRDIAAARIANGHPEGLPLNADGTLVEY